MGFLRQILDVITAPVRWLLAAPRKLLEGSRRLSGLSLPARVAIFTAVMLVLIVVFALVGFISTHERAFWRAKLTPTFAIATTILVLVIPLVLYKALQLWLEGEVSPYPDIDRAWKAGLAELDRQGIELHQVPLFVVLGTSGVRQEKSLFDAARLELTLRELPAGSAALHWYAGPNGVYLVCSAVGCLSRLAVLGYETLAAERSHAAERRQRGGGGSLRGTEVQAAPSARATSFVSPANSAKQAAASVAMIQGTMIVVRRRRSAKAMTRRPPQTTSASSSSSKARSSNRIVAWPTSRASSAAFGSRFARSTASSLCCPSA